MPAARWTAQRRAAFLTVLSETGNVSAAARSVRMSRAGAYRLKADDESFAEDWAEALEVAVDSLEAEARRRALEGVETPHFYQGQVAGTVRKYSDPLLMFLLRAHRPERYRDRAPEQTSPDADLEQDLASARETLAARLADLDGAAESADEAEAAG